MQLSATLSWLVDAAGETSGPDRLLAEVGARLVADGLPLAGGALTLAVPHPLIAAAHLALAGRQRRSDRSPGVRGWGVRGGRALAMATNWRRQRLCASHCVHKGAWLPESDYLPEEDRLRMFRPDVRTAECCVT
jgi:hypothetical protein